MLLFSLLQILEYHIIPGLALFAANFTNGKILGTAYNESLQVQERERGMLASNC